MNTSTTESATASIAEGPIQRHGSTGHKQKRSIGFPFLFFTVGAFAIVFGHWFSGVTRELVHHYFPYTGSHPWVLIVVSSVCFLASAWWIYIWRFNAHSVLWPALAALVSGHVLAFEAHGWLHYLEGGHFETLLLAGLITIALTGFLHNLEHQLETVRTLSSDRAQKYQKINRVRAIILFVSKPDMIPVVANGNAAEDAGFHARVVGAAKKSPEQSNASGNNTEVTLNGTDLATDIGALDSIRFNWQQLLRAILPHQGLKDIWLIGSPGEKGSGQHLELCARFLKPYVPEARIHYSKNPVEFIDFEDFKALSDKLWHIVHKDLKGLTADEVVIDVTGGQKTASIAGAVLTLNSATVFQYVPTGSSAENPLLEPYIYDLRWDKPKVH